MGKVCTAAEAVRVVRSGHRVGSLGVIGWLTPDTLLGALAERFRTEREPRDLTFFFPVSVGDAMGIRGMDHVAMEGPDEARRLRHLHQCRRSADGDSGRS